MKSLKSISNTFIFENYSKSLHLDKTIVKMTMEGSIVTEEEIKDQLYEINRRYSFASKQYILDLYNEGKYKLLFNNKEGYRLPNTIPFYLINTGKGITCLVNISNYATKTENGLINIDTKTLYTLMQGGAIMVMCYQKYNHIINKPKLIMEASLAYSKLFCKILNKMFSVNIDPVKQDNIVFLTSYFFIVNVLGKEDKELAMKYAMSNCKSTTQLAIDNTINSFADEDFADIDKFITAMAKNIRGLETLNTRAFISNYINTYGPSMIFSLEFLPIFLFNLFAVVTGSYINSSYIIENTMGNDLDKLFKEFFSL